MSPLLIGGLGTPELVLILAVVVLLFGATKLPDLARGSGRALRIFKAETKGLVDDGNETKTPEQLAIEQKQAELNARQAELDAERERLERNDGA
jgi:sec-independent protein translocase protein TatA